ncbi:prolyl oligopeptidase family serine peptidase [Harryflintia acetispora]|uniref:carboxylesterase family protein n=1 Tax=Harryflintia acetispora TaxID=1849041 RepID=UPI002570DE4A|nr:prolyl oligopeptidase family serine peptidase [Harryflintia acetispora]
MNIIAFALTGAVLLTACCTTDQLSSRDIGSAVPALQSSDKVEIPKDMSGAYVTDGVEVYEDFVLDNVLHSDNHAEIHYNLYIPENYDGTRSYALFITLPGWEGLYFQGVGENIRREKFGREARKYHDDMIVVAPQLSDWGETSAEETIALTEYFLSNYNIDRKRIYINGYSGGGETLSIVLAKRPELFTAALHCASQWDGDLTVLAQSRTPLYLAVGERDEYYGPESVQRAYQLLCDLYAADGLTEEDIRKLVVLDVKDQEYFSARGQTNQHGGSVQFAFDQQMMSWLFGDHGEPVESESQNNKRVLTSQAKVSDVMLLPAFHGFGQFL